MSYRSEEWVRLAVKKIADDARGVQRAHFRMSSARQSELQISNFHMLPVQIAPNGTDSTSPTAQKAAPLQVGGQSTFLAGYSAAAGTPAALPDATGRGGDTVVSAMIATSGGARATALLRVAFPLTATGASGGGAGTAALVIV